MAGEDYYGGGSPVIYFTFTVDGVDRIEKHLGVWGAAVQDLSPALEEVGAGLRADFMQNMISEGSFYSGGRGRTWAPLRPATNKDRVRKGYPAEHPILWRDGTLGQALATRGALGNVSEVDKTRGVFGTDLPYAQYHQTGTSKMLPRKIVGMTRERRRTILETVGNYVRAAARAAGLNARG